MYNAHLILTSVGLYIILVRAGYSHVNLTQLSYLKGGTSIENLHEIQLKGIF